MSKLLFQESARDLREKDCPVHWYKFIAPMIPKNVTTRSSIPEHTPVHVTYSYLASKNHQCTINFHDGYPPLYVLIPEDYIPPSLPTSTTSPLPSFTLVLISFTPPKTPHMIFQSNFTKRGDDKFFQLD